MSGPEAHSLADPEGREPILDVGSQLCTQCGLCCTGALHNYAVLGPGEVPFARTLGLKIRTEGKPGFALPCPRLVNSVCSIYECRPQVCARYKCRLLENVEAGASDLQSAIDKVRTAKELVAQVDTAMPRGMTLPEARERTRDTPTSDGGVPKRFGGMQLKLAVTALSFYLDRYFRHPKEGNLLSLETLTEEPIPEMK